MSYYNAEILAGKTNLIGMLKSIKNFFLNNEVCKFSVESEKYDTEKVYNSYLQLKYKNLIIKFTGCGSDSSNEFLRVYVWDVNKKVFNSNDILYYVKMVGNISYSIYDSSMTTRNINIFLLKTDDILTIGISPYGINPLLDYQNVSSNYGFIYYEENKNFFKYCKNSSLYDWQSGDTSIRYNFIKLTNTPRDDNKIIFIPKTQQINLDFSNQFEEFYEGLFSAAGATAGDFYSFNDKVYFAIFPNILIEAGEKIKYNPPQEANT